MKKIFGIMLVLMLSMMLSLGMAQDSNSTEDMSDDAMMSDSMMMDDMMMAHKRVTVTITNTTENQIFSPPLVYNHMRDFELYTLGESAMPEVAVLAEDGDNSQVATVARVFPNVNSVVSSTGPLMPGESVTLELDIHPDHHYVSVTGMLVTTNDAVFYFGTPVVSMGDDMMDDDMMSDDMSDDDAMMSDDMSDDSMSDDSMSDDAMSDDSMMSDDMMDDDNMMDDNMMDDDMMDDDMMSDDMMSDTMMEDINLFNGEVFVFDAGTEANTESCAHIPGPPCGNGGVRVTNMAEGAVSLHKGLSGEGELAAYIWTNPVATIVIETVQ